jgi:hypothetical protein
MTTETINTTYSALVPAGRRIEVRWFDTPRQPLVKDLDTGAVFADAPIETGLPVARTLVGTVRRCRIVSDPHSGYDDQTYLEVEPDA